MEKLTKEKSFLFDLSIVIPVFNSENNLEPLMDELVKALNFVLFEIILINDRSVDKSWDKIMQLSKKYPQLTGINLRKNSGQNNAVMCGLKHAVGKYIVIMDDDLQHSPADIPKLLGEIEKGYDAVYAKFKRKNQVLWKNIGSWINGKAAEILINKPKNIYLSPFKIFTDAIRREIIKYKGSYPYIDGILFMVTPNISQVENIEHYKRFEGKSNFSFIKSLSVFLSLITNFSMIPLQLSVFLGIISSFSSFILGLYFFIEYFMNNSIPEGYTSIILLILFLGGLILISLGVLGEYIGRIFMNNQNIEPFIIKEIIGRDND
ncbi:MAG: glycosyltransferase family 2 protein [Ferruginibacter sp.]